MIGYGPVEEETASTGSSLLLSEKNGRSWFPVAKKSVTLVKIWYFLKNWLSLIVVTVSTGRKNL